MVEVLFGSDRVKGKQGTNKMFSVDSVVFLGINRGIQQLERILAM